jgi:hypothetical protein
VSKILIQDYITEAVNLLKVMTQEKIMSELDMYPQADTLTVLSELVMNGTITRVEYTLPDRVERRYMYLPGGSRIVG